MESLEDAINDLTRRFARLKETSSTHAIEQHAMPGIASQDTNQLKQEHCRFVNGPSLELPCYTQEDEAWAKTVIEATVQYLHKSGIDAFVIRRILLEQASKVEIESKVQVDLYQSQLEVKRTAEYQEMQATIVELKAAMQKQDQLIADMSQRLIVQEGMVGTKVKLQGLPPLCAVVEGSVNCCCRPQHLQVCMLTCCSCACGCCQRGTSPLGTGSLRAHACTGRVADNQARCNTIWMF